MKPLILASRSPRRAELLSRAGFEFLICDPGIEEMKDAPPHELCLINAQRKARAVADRHAGATVLAADTVVALPGRVFGKPVDLSEALEMLRALAGCTHEVLTGVCIVGKAESRSFVESTRVTFHPDHQIDYDAYLARVNPLDKAGAYAAQEDNGALIASMHGSIENVIGLPIPRVVETLADPFGIFARAERAHGSKCGGSEPRSRQG